MVDAERTQITVDDLLTLNSGDVQVEIVNGEIIELPPVGLMHHLIAGNIYRMLDAHVVKNRLGIVLMDGLIFLLDKDSAGIKGARIPDVAYIRKEDFPTGWDMEKPYPLAPTLAIEVMSPSDVTEDTLHRVRDYLNAGTEEVWVVYPRQKEVHQYRESDLSHVAVYRGDDVIDTTKLFPDLKIVTATLFEIPDWMTTQA